MPTINTNYKNVFMNHKRVRPPTVPESYLDKTYVVAEGVFDFGPLLIGKDGAKRDEDTSMKAINSSEIRVTNNGQFDVEASFVLKSSLPLEEGGPGEPGPFILEPETMTLKKDETQNLTVWSFPTEAKQYRDEIVCLLKDNPNPSIFPVQVLGAKPVVDVDQDVVEFDRLLLGKHLQKTLTLKNNSSIPANWKLTGIDELPEEFQVDCREGKLAPCAEQVINITFTAKEEKILDPTITLEVEDTEGRGVQQEAKPIKL
jgi:hydrocephalus-inducing protein